MSRMRWCRHQHPRTYFSKYLARYHRYLLLARGSKSIWTPAALRALKRARPTTAPSKVIQLNYVHKLSFTHQLSQLTRNKKYLSKIMQILVMAAKFEFMTWFPTMILILEFVQVSERVQISNGTFSANRGASAWVVTIRVGFCFFIGIFNSACQASF